MTFKSQQTTFRSFVGDKKVVESNNEEGCDEAKQSMVSHDDHVVNIFESSVENCCACTTSCRKNDQADPEKACPEDFWLLFD